MPLNTNKKRLFPRTGSANSYFLQMLKKKRYPSHFTARLTPEEWEVFERNAAGLPLTEYFKQCVLGDDATKAHTKGKRPVKDYTALAQIMATLGNLNIRGNLNEIAHSIKAGNLVISQEIEQLIHQACIDIRNIRTLLIKALGLKPKNPSDH